MHWTSKEPFWFDDAAYEARARNMSAEALWTRQCKKHRTTVSSSTGVGFGSIMVIPTMGMSTVGLWASGRTLDIARRKKKVIDAEALRRNLPPYYRKKRDTLIPLGISLAVIGTVVTLDIMFFAGTSSAVLGGAAAHGINALPMMVHDPSHFFIGVGHGVDFQLQQFFHFGSQTLAIGPDQVHTVVGAKGLHEVVGGLATTPINDPTIATTIASFKAHVAAMLHSKLAALSPSGPGHLAMADKSILTAALSSPTPGPPAELSGAAIGVNIMETIETCVARFVIASTGLEGISVNTSGKNEDATKEQEAVTHLPQANTDAVRLAQTSVLTGESPKCFLFLGKSLQPVSQRIITPPSTQRCAHDKATSITKRCIFCMDTIDSQIRPYYHCCSCSLDSEQLSTNYDICETCVAGRGCSCTNRAGHTLFRKGRLGETIEYGDLLE